jgi:hypothetical protein
MACNCKVTWPSVKCVCGNFETPVVPDEGQCSPYREKRSCEAPELPVITCDDDEYVTIFQPENATNPFKVSARLFDENCEVVTDENDEDILTYVA